MSRQTHGDSSWSELKLGFLSGVVRKLRRWLAPREQQAGLFDEAEELVLREHPVKLFRGELVLAAFKREHVPIVPFAVEDIDRSGCLILRDHLQQQDALACLDPAGSDGLADFEEGGDGLFEEFAARSCQLNNL